MKLGKLVLIGALTFGSFTAIEMTMLTKQASAATQDNFTVVSTANSYYQGQSFLFKATNDNPYSVWYQVSIEKLVKDKWEYYDADGFHSELPANTDEGFDIWTGWGGQIVSPGMYRLKVETKHSDGKTGVFYTEPIELKKSSWMEE
ncbi:DUF5065 family protein [Bacillus cereus]|uniref:DUF5065 family protein n=1 Tax=Bacillus sp. UNC322MFChir4.1 TaxID=1449045 RepID=UPI00054EE2E8|nr:DUF5065 family protein [Bacillus sp. UNC322MFChir4.1]